MSAALTRSPEVDFQVAWFEGNYQDYEADAISALTPTPTRRIGSGTSGKNCTCPPLLR